MKIQKLLELDNIASKLDKDELEKIGRDVVEGYESDLQSREPWEKDIQKWTELALQISKEKTYPWPKASNVKYPLLATAAMQFAARAYPSLVPSDGKIVKVAIVGYDPQGEKTDRAERLGKHMSYQVMNEMDDWEEDMDKLLLSLPIVGTIFKKTYWNSAKQKNHSCLVFPKNLVVNYWAKSLEDAERKTEWFELSPRKIKEKQLLGIYRDDVDLATATSHAFPEDKIKDVTQRVSKDDETTPYLILEQHTYLDLDKDGYSEPYIVTVEYTSRSVLRIVARFTAADVKQNDKDQVISIEPLEFYTKYSFIPNPDGGFYDIGFGRLLGTINASVDTIINQLIDAGTLSNLQAGFLGKGLRIKMGESKFQPGEWKTVNATGDDLKKQILPLPVNPPSEVLMNLLQYLVQSGRDLASVAEIFVGKMPGQNTPATTTMASIEQGMKVFTAVYKRIYRSLTKEFRKLYKLNRQYLDPKEYIAALDVEIQQSDYLGDENDVVPGADPAAVSNQEKQQKAQVLLQAMGLGTLNVMEVTKYLLAAHEIPALEKFLQEPQPQPDPKMEEMKMKAQIEQQKAQSKMQLDQIKMQITMAEGEQKLKLEQQLNEMELKFKYMEHALEAQMAASKASQDMQIAGADHAANMIRTQQSHMQQMEIQKEQAKNKPTPKGKDTK
jgi:chaperonin GroES